MKNFLSPLLCSALLGGLLDFACVPASFADEQKELVALAPMDWPPQYQVDEDGEPYGFAISIMEQVAQAAGYRVVYKTCHDYSFLTPFNRSYSVFSCDSTRAKC